MGVPEAISPLQGAYAKEILFLLIFFCCAKGLSTLTKKSVQDGDMEGVAMFNLHTQLFLLEFLTHRLLW